jgi:hypothetical protein
MTQAQIAALIEEHKKDVRGTLRVFGDWFERPHDNYLTHTGVSGEDDHLALGFDGGEVLKVLGRSAPEFSSHRLGVRFASRVRWEWFCYGRPHLPENRYFLDYVVAADRVNPTTNVDWYTPDLKPSLNEYAVTLD